MQDFNVTVQDRILALVKAILDQNASSLLRIGQERQGTASSSARTR